jgi:hypothetical protein
MDRITDLLKDKFESLASESRVTKTEDTVLKPETEVLKAENTVLKTENVSLKAQLQTQQDKYEQLSTNFRDLAHAHSRNVWHPRSVVGGALLMAGHALIQLGGFTTGIEAADKYSRLLYTSGKQIAFYVSDSIPEHTVPSPEQRNNKPEKWATLFATSGIQVNSMTPSRV